MDTYFLIDSKPFSLFIDKSFSHTSTHHGLIIYSKEVLALMLKS